VARTATGRVVSQRSVTAAPSRPSSGWSPSGPSALTRSSCPATATGTPTSAAATDAVRVAAPGGGTARRTAADAAGWSARVRRPGGTGGSPRPVRDCCPRQAKVVGGDHPVVHACEDTRPHVCGVSGTNHQARVVACRDGHGRRGPPGRRPRSHRHRTRTRGAPAPHDRVLRPRGAQAGIHPGTPGRGPRPRTGGGVPRLDRGRRATTSTAVTDQQGTGATAHEHSMSTSR
jgi:hypothetical protein